MRKFSSVYENFSISKNMQIMLQKYVSTLRKNKPLNKITNHNITYTDKSSIFYLFHIENGRKFYSNNKFSFCDSQLNKINYNLFIKENSELKNLKYKEEIFEYMSLFSKDIKDTEIILAIDKLENFEILESEVRYFKFFIRDILEMQEKLIEEEIIIKFIKYYVRNINKIKKYSDNDYISIENNNYDLNFDNINASILSFAMFNLHKIKDNKNLKPILELVNLVVFQSKTIKKDFIEKIQIKFLQNINLQLWNNPIYLGKINKENQVSDDILFFCLFNISEYDLQKFTYDENLIEILKYLNLYLKEKFDLNQKYNINNQTRYSNCKLNDKQINLLNILYGILKKRDVDYKKLENSKKENYETDSNEQNLHPHAQNQSFELSKDYLSIVKNLNDSIEKIILISKKITRAKFKEEFEKKLNMSKDELKNFQEFNNLYIEHIFNLKL